MTTPEPELDAQEIEALRRATEEAVEATSTAYTRDAATDVERRLRDEMGRRGIELDDEEWVVEVTRAIRSGHGISFDPEEPDGDAG